MKWAVIIVIFLIALPIAAFGFIGMYQYNRYRGGPIPKAAGVSSGPMVSDDCLSLIYPKVNNEAGFAKALDDFIAKTKSNSPLKGTGSEMVTAGKIESINPAFVVGIALKESVLGTDENSGGIKAGSSNSFGRTWANKQPHLPGRRWYKYPTFQSSVSVNYADNQFVYMRRKFVNANMNTPEKVMEVYAPRKENNTDLYIRQLKNTISDIMTMAGSSVTCGANINVSLIQAQN